MTTVLVVDDEPSILDIVSMFLEAEGYQVVQARNGREGLDRARAERPDVVISDVMMPLLDGRELCNTIHGDPDLSTIPVIMMSAAGESAIRDSCHPDAFITKPFDLEVLLDTISTVVTTANGHTSQG